MSKIVIPVFDGVEVLDVAGPSSVFSLANTELGRQYYELAYATASKDSLVTASCGLALGGRSLDSAASPTDVLLVPGADIPELNLALKDSKFLSLVASLAEKTERCTSVCTGAFFLGQVGLLDGHRATTHWLATERLAKEFPQCRVETNVLFQRDEGLWTSAGVTSGIDMALAMVREDLGNEVALRVARRMVVFLIRTGGQSQYEEPINLLQATSDDSVKTMVAWIQKNMHSPIMVSRLAEETAMSERTLHRRCVDAFGLTPSRLIKKMRLERARALLLDVRVPLKRIASDCGFSSVSVLSKAFINHYGVSPTRYRESFG